MKRVSFCLICVLVGTLLSACDRSKSIYSSSIKITVIDTVLIDSKGELLFLTWGLSTATMSADGSKLYNFNVDEPSLEVIDLEKHTLDYKTPLEREGPNGIGQRGKGGILALSDQLLLFRGWPAPYVMDLNGRRTDLLENLVSVKSSVTPSGRDFMYEIMHPEFPNLVFGSTNEYPGKNFEFTTLDLSDNSILSIPLTAWDVFSNYSLGYDDGSQFDLWTPRIYVTVLGRYICLSTDITSDLYLYDPSAKQLIFKKFSHRLTPIHKTPTGSIKTSDPAQFQATFRKLYGDISFHPPFWDNTNQIYYRFSHTTTFQSDEEGLYPKPTEQQVYLSLIEADFTLSAEFSLDFLKEVPAFGFSKEGEIWTYLNVNDEMAFIRMKAPNNAP